MHSIDEKINSVEKDKMLFLASLDWKFLLLVAITKAGFILMTTLTIVFAFKDRHLSNRRLLGWSKYLFRTARFVFRRAYGFNNVKEPYLIALVFFFLILFDFFVQQLVLINIKTSKIVIDTDSLITDQRSLFKSPRKIAWLGSERGQFIAKNSPKNTFLYKLYYLKNENPIRVVQNRVDANLMAALNSNLFFLGALLSSIALNYIAPLSPRKFFLNDDPLFSSNNVLYRKKESSPQMHYIDAYVTKLLESGVAQLVRKRLKTTKLSEDREFVLENKVFRGVESYVSQNTFYEPINFYNFYYIFASYLTMCTSIALLLVTVRFAAQIQVQCLQLLARFLKMARKITRMARRLKLARPFSKSKMLIKRWITVICNYNFIVSSSSERSSDQKPSVHVVPSFEQ